MKSKKHIISQTPANRTISVLLVDDEIGAIKTLRNMLGQYCPQINICSVALSVQEAVAAAVKHLPELVFLDIQMPPHGSGFDFLKNCPYSDFGVIFTTAYPQFAVEAINTIQPWAYLVKPYSVADLRKAVAVAEEKLLEKAQNNAGQTSLIVQDSRKGRLVIRTDAIVFCRAGGSFTEIFVLRDETVEKIISSRNLGEHIAEMPAEHFCRVHHSYFVNLNFVERLERTGRNGIIHLETGHRVPVSVSKMDEFQQALEVFTQGQQRTVF